MLELILDSAFNNPIGLTDDLEIEPLELDLSFNIIFSWLLLSTEGTLNSELMEDEDELNIPPITFFLLLPRLSSMLLSNFLNLSNSSSFLFKRLPILGVFLL